MLCTHITQEKTMNNWWPYTDEEWEELNFPNTPKK